MQCGELNAAFLHSLSYTEYEVSSQSKPHSRVHPVLHDPCSNIENSETAVTKSLFVTVIIIKMMTENMVRTIQLGAQQWGLCGSG